MPSDFANSKAVLNAASVVRIVRTTSTSFISGTGLKKCRPTNCFGRAVAIDSSVIVSDDVFDAKIASFFTIESIAAYVSFLTCGFSVIASITMSHCARSFSDVEPFRRDEARVLVRRGQLPLLHELAEALVDPGHALVEKFLLDLDHDRVVAGLRRDLRDARSHQAAAEDAHFLDCHE